MTKHFTIYMKANKSFLFFSLLMACIFSSGCTIKHSSYLPLTEKIFLKNQARLFLDFTDLSINYAPEYKKEERIFRGRISPKSLEFFECELKKGLTENNNFILVENKQDSEFILTFKYEEILPEWGNRMIMLSGISFFVLPGFSSGQNIMTAELSEVNKMKPISLFSSKEEGLLITHLAIAPFALAQILMDDGHKEAVKIYAKDIGDQVISFFQNKMMQYK